MPPLPSLISVVLPVFNQAQYLPQSIRSVFAAHQKFPLELIVVDDGSTDNFAKTIEEFNDPRLKVVRLPNNQGLASALNIGFEHTRGEFLTWTSADNIYEPLALDVLAAFLSERTTIGFVYGNVRLIDEAGHPVPNSSYRPQDQSAEDSSVLLLPRCPEALPEWHDNFINACFLYRRAVYEHVGAFRSNLAGAEDFDYWLRAGLVTQLAHVAISRPLYRYRLHDQSFTSRLDTETLTQLASDCARRARRELDRQGSRERLAILKRAREKNFHAVTPPPSSTASVLLFCPESTNSEPRLVELIQAQPAICFVVLARSTRQREFADRTNVTLNGANNLRIVDLSLSKAPGFLPEEEPLAELTSIMFVLSSVDGVIALAPPERWLEEYAEKAGKGLLAILPQAPNSASACPVIVAPNAASIRTGEFSQQFRQVIASFRAARENFLKETALSSD